MQYSAWTPDVNQNISQGNRFVYFKQNNTNSYQSVVSNTILINPNFKTSVHVNPKFAAANRIVSSVYINPNVFKCSNSAFTSVEQCSLTQKPVTSNVLTHKQAAGNGKTFTNITNSPIANNVISKPIIATRTKIVRLPAKETPADNERRVVQSKYKLVKAAACVKPVTPLGVSNSHRQKSKFKIDNRIAEHGKEIKRVINKNKNGNYIAPRKSSVSYIKIGGITYKKSRMKLQRSSSFENKNKKNRNVATPKRKNHKIVIKSGVRYEVNINRRTLKRVTDTGLKNSVIKKPTPERMKRLRAILFAKKNFIKSRCIFKKSKQNVHPSPNKLKKCNVPCMFYRKFGRCRGKDRGVCNKIHDPAHTIVCPRFLQGACVNKTCLLSHNVSSEKMPTCKFFLEGMCSKEDCPYLHVKVNPKAEVCLDFLKGYCKKGKECDNRHQYLCPDYEKNGKCLKKKCPYPHGVMVRSSVRKKQKLSIKQQKIIRPNCDNSNNVQKSLDAVASCNTRYYKELVNSEVHRNPEIELKRSKLGKLPGFIPLADFAKSYG